MSQQSAGTEDNVASSGDNTDASLPAPGFSEPNLQLWGAAGIAAVTPESAVFCADNATSITAGHDINSVAQGQHCQLATKGITLFTSGQAADENKPIQETGIKLHAASGKVSIKSQSDATRIAADKTITVTSVTRSVNIQALEHVLLTALGAFIKLEGGNIELCAPGTIEFKAGAKEFAGPQSADAPHVESRISSVKGCAQATADASASQAGMQQL